MSNQIKLSEIRAREKAATEGPWESFGRDIFTMAGVIAVVPVPQTGGVFACEANKEFIIGTRTDVPYLLDLVKRLGKALKHYDGIGRDCTGCEEARALLLEIKE